MQGDKGLEHFDQVEKQLSTELGRDLDKELQGAFGEEVVVSSSTGAKELNASLERHRGRSRRHFPVKDAAKTEELLTQLLTRFTPSRTRRARKG